MPKPISRKSTKLVSDARWRMSWLTTIVILLGLAIVVSVPGCSGCLRSKTAAEEDAAKKKKQAEEQKKPEFEPPEFRALPFDDRGPGNYIKPGHWVSGSIRLKANDYDYRGELYSKTTNQTGGSIPLPGTNYYFSATRPIALAKGQESWSDVTYYVPEVNPNPAEGISNSRWLQCRLQSRGGGAAVQAEVLPTLAMPAHQFYMVVLAANSDEYQFLSALDTVKPLSASMDQNEAAPHYRVVTPKIIDRTPLPENPLTWTSIAVIVWDDIDQQTLTTYQQEALLDWLHWGGQLIISGPGSLDRLRLSFLADYLPAQSEGAEELDQTRFEPWNQKYVMDEQVDGKKVRYDVKLGDAPARGVKLKLHEDAYYVQDTADLVVERRIGRGRITVTAFQLRDPRITKQWKNFDNFFNAAILRRPPRRYEVTDIEFVTTRWDSKRSRNDPLAVSQLRYFSRDVESSSRRYDKLDNEYREENGLVPTRARRDNIEAGVGIPVDEMDDARFSELPDAGFTATDAGVAAWNDNSGAANAARECLVEASGINIPDAAFILRVTAVYLLVLVPLNWGVFWLIGRVEWAWIAAPVIAIVGSFAVIKLAQLDIGFARNRTEIGILEIQPDYHRAHMARYTSLYTSLSTSYHSEFDQASALALPLTFATGQAAPTRFGDATTEVRFDQEGLSASLTGFNVMSNSTGRMHSEYMLSLAQEAVFSWKPADDGKSAEVIYRGELAIHDVAVIRRIGDSPSGAEVAWIGDLEVAWIGELNPKQAKTIRFEPMTDPWSVCPEWNQTQVFSPDSKNAEVSLRRLLNVAKDVRHLRAGDVRLIGWTDQDVPGVAITPEAPQRTLRTLVVAHLKFAPLPDPQSDANTRRILGQEPEKLLQDSVDSIELLPEDGPT